MSVNDSCRFCHLNLRINGVISHSLNIFESRCITTGKTVFDRLAELGLTLTKSYKKSKRSCKKCVTVLSRLEDGLPAFRRWEEQEKAHLSTAASSAGRSDTEVNWL